MTRQPAKAQAGGNRPAGLALTVAAQVAIGLPPGVAIGLPPGAVRNISPVG
jgi:hypothetical protein